LPNDVRVEVFSDVICPWCYIGHTRFARAAERFDGPVEVIHRPFQLDPEAVSEGEPLLSALARKFGADTARMTARVTSAAEEAGLRVRFDRAVAAGTFEAHRLIEVAAGQDRAAAMSERLFRAYFTDGLDVGDPAVLASLAAETGVADTGQGGAEVRAQLTRARELGIGSVPLFLFEERYAVSGAQPEETFLATLGEVADRLGERPPPPADGCAEETCAV
jgi:predicted DsbA family dithiol-disulfide isomerase